MRYSPIWMSSLAIAIWICLRVMARLMLIEAPRLSLRQEARALASLGNHVHEIQTLYEQKCLALARKMIGAANLSPDIRAVEVVETEEGFAIPFAMGQKRD